MDIGFGPYTSIDAMCNCLHFVDKATTQKHVYQLKNLIFSLLPAVNIFLPENRVKYKMIHTDFDPNFISGKVSELLEKIECID